MRGSHAVKAVRTGFIFLHQSTFVLDIFECFFKLFGGFPKFIDILDYTAPEFYAVFRVRR